jgi:hypothetical protein
MYLREPISVHLIFCVSAGSECSRAFTAFPWSIGQVNYKAEEVNTGCQPLLAAEWEEYKKTRRLCQEVGSRLKDGQTISFLKVKTER